MPRARFLDTATIVLTQVFLRQYFNMYCSTYVSKRATGVCINATICSRYVVCYTGCCSNTCLVIAKLVQAHFTASKYSAVRTHEQALCSVHSDTNCCCKAHVQAYSVSV
eukprot:2307-Heterococcus_DN1.PRE.3